GNVDCQSNNCISGTCQAVGCTDGVKNGAETDIDCGGATCPKCAQGKGCGVNSDCTTNNCVSGTCGPPPVTQFAYTPSNFNPTGTGVDPSVTDPTTTLDCGVSTYDSNTNQFGNWCGQKPPTSVVQNGIVILPLRGLSIGATGTLKITGNKPVII